jgi:hypothetical protein
VANSLTALWRVFVRLKNQPALLLVGSVYGHGDREDDAECLNWSDWPWMDNVVEIASFRIPT